MSALFRVEKRLSAQVIGFDPRLNDYFRHALGGQGKRLRPALSLLSGMAASGSTYALGDRHIDLAVIVELIHIATLVHDDVVDQAELRHNQPTSRALWGSEIAVLLGDCLFAHALKLASAFPTTEVCRHVSEATNTVCSGEILQTRRRFDPTLTITEYLKMIEMKTAALFSVSCNLGAFLTNATASVRQMLSDYGHYLGAAYQIYDDCVDIFGEESREGKSLGSDLACGKFTLPVLFYLDQAPPRQRPAFVEELNQLARIGREPVQQILDEHHALEHSLHTLDHYLEQAQAILDCLEDCEGTRTLTQATQFLLRQAHALAKHPIEKPSAPVIASTAE